MKGMIVYSWAWRKGEDSPCNVRLALRAKRIADAQGETVVIHAQRTTAKVLRELGIECHATERQSVYEGSEEPNRQAAKLFKQMGITEVIPVANPFIHLFKCISLVKAEGFKTPSFWQLCKMIGWIGFDPLSVQAGTRGPVRCVVYTVLQVLFGYRYPLEQSEP